MLFLHIDSPEDKICYVAIVKSHRTESFYLDHLPVIHKLILESKFWICYYVCKIRRTEVLDICRYNPSLWVDCLGILITAKQTSSSSLLLDVPTWMSLKLNYEVRICHLNHRTRVKMVGPFSNNDSSTSFIKNLQRKNSLFFSQYCSRQQKSRNKWFKFTIQQCNCKRKLKSNCLVSSDTLNMCRRQIDISGKKLY